MEPTESKTSRILVIEDDRELIDLLDLHLRSEGYQVAAAADGEAGLRAFEGGTFALVVLDWMLPSLSGIEVLKRIRARNRRVPVLMLTARGDETDKVLGLELGCDDYMTKPFSVRELVARVKVLLRRVLRAEEIARAAAGAQLIDLGELVIDHARRRVTVRGTPVQLTVKEYDLLHTLADRFRRFYTGNGQTYAVQLVAFVVVVYLIKTGI